MQAVAVTLANKMLSSKTATFWPNAHSTNNDVTTTHLYWCWLQKLLGVLVRQNCISIAVSNPYLNLAEPIG
jgi:hypothetical protein